MKKEFFISSIVIVSLVLLFNFNNLTGFQTANLDPENQDTLIPLPVYLGELKQPTYGSLLCHERPNINPASVMIDAYQRAGDNKVIIITNKPGEFFVQAKQFDEDLDLVYQESFSILPGIGINNPETSIEINEQFNSKILLIQIVSPGEFEGFNKFILKQEVDSSILPSINEALNRLIIMFKQYYYNNTLPKEKYYSYLFEFSSNHLSKLSPCSIINLLDFLYSSEFNDPAFPIIGNHILNLLLEKDVILDQGRVLKATEFTKYLSEEQKTGLSNYLADIKNTVMMVDQRKENVGLVKSTTKKNLCTDSAEWLDYFVDKFERESDFDAKINIFQTIISLSKGKTMSPRLTEFFNSLLVDPLWQTETVKGLAQVGTDESVQLIIDNLFENRLTRIFLDDLTEALISSKNLAVLTNSYERVFNERKTGLLDLFEQAISSTVQQCDLDKTNAVLQRLLTDNFNSKNLLLKTIIDNLNSCSEQIKTAEEQGETQIVDTLADIFYQNTELQDEIVNLFGRIGTASTFELLTNFASDSSLSQSLRTQIAQVLQQIQASLSTRAGAFIKGKYLQSNLKNVPNCNINQPLPANTQQKLNEYLNTHQNLLNQYNSAKTNDLYQQLSQLENTFVQSMTSENFCDKQKLINILANKIRSGIIVTLQLQYLDSKQLSIAGTIPQVTPEDLATLWPSLTDREKQRILEFYTITGQNIPYTVTKEELLGLLGR